MDGLEFQKVKNSLFNEYGLLDKSRFFDLIAQSNTHFWKEIGEVSPFSGYSKLPDEIIAGGTLERLAIEPYPEKFLELCVALGEHIKYVSMLPAKRNEVEGLDMQKEFMNEVEAAFKQHKQDFYLNITLHSDKRIIGHDDYALQGESKKIVLNGFRSKTVEEYIEKQTLPYRAKIHRKTMKKQNAGEHKWFWWTMSIIGALIASLIGAYAFGVGK